MIRPNCILKPAIIKKFICLQICCSKITKKVIIIRTGKSCGCLIASNVIALEIQKKKKELKIKELKEKLVKTRSKKKIPNLKRKHKELTNSLKEVYKHKKDMKRKFDDYVKNSGYVPPIFKNRR